MDVDVFIVGAGPTGLMAACELSRRGLVVRIIDQKPSLTAESRALGVQAHTLELFDKLDLADRAIERGIPLRAVSIANCGRQIGTVKFQSAETRFPFVLSLPQSDIERLLIERLEELGVRVEWNTRLVEFVSESTGVRCTIEHHTGGNETATAGWLIGCDGAHSVTRKQLGVSIEGERTPEWFALADVKTDWGLSPNEVHIFIHSDGPLAVFPLPTPRTFRLIAPLLHSPADEEPKLDLSAFERFVKDRAGQTVHLTDPIWLSSFMISRRIVNSYRVGRVLLAGDAAHLHSPVGGQGMNTGLHDAFNLAWKVAMVHRGTAPDSLVDTYQEERHPIGERTLSHTHLATMVLTMKNHFAQSLRDRLLAGVLRLPSVGKKVFEAISMLEINYRQSPIVEDCATSKNPLNVLWGTDRPRAGDRAPDFDLAAADSSGPKRFHELLRTTQHVLAWFRTADSSDQHFPQIEELSRRYREVLSCCRVGPDAPALSADSSSAWTKVVPRTEGKRALPYRVPLVYLIRPDGYIAWRGMPNEWDRLSAYLARCFSI